MLADNTNGLFWIKHIYNLLDNLEICGIAFVAEFDELKYDATHQMLNVLRPIGTKMFTSFEQ
jgi:hypothetical protein